MIASFVRTVMISTVVRSLRSGATAHSSNFSREEKMTLDFQIYPCFIPFLRAAFQTLFLKRFKLGFWRNFADACSRGSSCDENLACSTISLLARISWLDADCWEGFR
mmetsp:Transcript_17294/g.35551  ORF Transcript_17294/g.35551 Transcript_17294/m.35551 type:complete len:107 (-) Transcript_17294:368-688(-)